MNHEPMNHETGFKESFLNCSLSLVDLMLPRWRPAIAVETRFPHPQPRLTARGSWLRYGRKKSSPRKREACGGAIALSIGSRP